MKTLFQDKDIVLWEGDRNTDNEIIECIGSGNKSLFKGDDRLIAVVSDDYKSNELSVFKFSEVRLLVKWFLEKHQLIKSGKS